MQGYRKPTRLQVVMTGTIVALGLYQWLLDTILSLLFNKSSLN